MRMKKLTADEIIQKYLASSKIIEAVLMTTKYRANNREASYKPSYDNAKTEVVKVSGLNERDFKFYRYKLGGVYEKRIFNLIDISRCSVVFRIYLCKF